MTVTYLVVLDLIAVIGSLFCLAVPRLRKYAIELAVAPFAFATAALCGFVLVALGIAFASRHYGLELPDGSSLMCAVVSYVASGLCGIFVSHKILARYRPLREVRVRHVCREAWVGSVETLLRNHSVRAELADRTSVHEWGEEHIANLPANWDTSAVQLNYQINSSPKKW